MRKLTVPLGGCGCGRSAHPGVDVDVLEGRRRELCRRSSKRSRISRRGISSRWTSVIPIYVTMFTEDGILDVGSGEIKGRKAIRDVIAKMPNSRTTGERAAPGVGPTQHLEHCHQGERQQGHGARLLVPLQQQQSGTAGCSAATATTRTMVKVNGQWFFTKRRIYNEGRAEVGAQGW